MATLAQPSAGDVFVNIGCGSGTLLIERLEHGPAQRALGFDVDESALACARANAEAGGHASALTLSCCDARALPLETGSVDAVVADLPYAMLLGNPSVNSTLYPELLSEAARVLVGGGSGVFITTQNRLMRGVLGRQSALWKLDSTVRVRVPHTGGYISPTIYSLVRRDLV
jgi:23S rRNA G2445 N2-methylase RlmL